jgi:uncharacterized protein YndB with AHSA1/START domain
MDKNVITVGNTVKAPIEKVWEYWNNPQHIIHWAFASDDWESPKAENDLRVGGKFKTVMAAKDKSASFDFGGTYTAIDQHKRIEYVMAEAGRHVQTDFTQIPEGVKITQTFEPENENTLEMQKRGWQTILDNFKKYVENN